MKSIQTISEKLMVCGRVEKQDYIAACGRVGNASPRSGKTHIPFFLIQRISFSQQIIGRTVEIFYRLLNRSVAVHSGNIKNGDAVFKKRSAKESSVGVRSRDRDVRFYRETSAQGIQGVPVSKAL